MSCAGSVSSLPVVACAQPGFSMFLRSLSKSGSSLSIPSFGDLGFLTSPRGSVRLDLFAPVVGIARTGLVFPLLLAEMATLDLSALLQSSARSGSSVSALALAKVGPPPPPHSLAQLELSTLATSSSRLGFIMPLPNCASVGLSMLLQSFARMGPVLPASGFAHMAPSMSTHSYVRLESLPLMVGISRADFVSPLSVASSTLLGTSLPPQSLGRLGSAMPALRFADSGPSLFSKSMGCLDPIVSVFGLSRAGSVFSMLVVDPLHLGSAPFARARACLGFFLLASDYLATGSSLFARKLSRLGFSAPASSRVRSEILSPALGSAHCDSSLSSHSCSWPGSFPIASCAARSGLPSLLRSSGRLEVSAFVPGLSRAGFVFLLPVASTVALELLLPPRSLTRLSSAALAPGSLHFGPSLPTQSSGRLDSAASVSGFSHTGPPTLLRSLSRAESLVLVSGLACMGAALPVLGCAHLGLLTLLRSFMRADLMAPFVDFGKSGSFVSTRSSARTDAPALPMGSSRLGLVFALLVVEATRPEPSLLPKSLACLGSAVPVSGAANSGSLLLIRGLVRCGSMPPLLGVAKSDYAYSLSVLGVTIPASSLLVRSHVRMDFALPAPGFAGLGSSVLIRCFAHLGPSVPAWGMSWLGASLPVPGSSATGSLLPLRSLSRAGPALPVPSLATCGFSPPPQHPSRSGFSVSLLGLARTGSVFLLPAADTTCPGTASLLRSSACTGSAVSVLGCTHPGLLLPSRSPGRLELLSSFVGLVRAGFVSSPLVPGTANPGPTLSIRSFSKTDFFVPVLFCSSAGLALPPRTLARISSSVSACGLGRMEVSLSVSGRAHSGVFLSLRSLARGGFAAFALQFSHMDFAASLQSSSCAGLAALAFGGSRTGSVSLLLVASTAQPDAFSLSQSSARLGSISFALDFLRPGLGLPLRSHSRLEPMVPPSGLGRCGFVSSPSVTESTTSGPSPSPHSFVRAGVVLLALQPSHLGSSLPLRSPAWADAAVVVCGISRPAALPSASGAAGTGSSSLPKSLAWTGSVVLASGMQHPGSFLSLRDHGQLGPVVSATGLARAGFVFLLSAAATTNPGFSLFPRSSACLGSFLPACQFARTGSSALPRTSACSGSAALASGVGRSGVLLFAPDKAVLGSPLSLRSPGRLGLVSSVSRFSDSGFPVPLHALARVGPAAFTSGLARAGPASPLPVTEATKPDLPLSLRSSSQLGFSSSALCFSHADPSLFLQQPARVGFTVFVFGLSWAGPVFALSAVDSAHLGSFLFPRSAA